MYRVTLKPHPIGRVRVFAYAIVLLFAACMRMGFLQSYLNLPRYQRVLLGLSGVAIGWYGPSIMNYLFLDSSSPQSDKEVKSEAE